MVCYTTFLIAINILSKVDGINKIPISLCDNVVEIEILQKQKILYDESIQFGFLIALIFYNLSTQIDINTFFTLLFQTSSIYYNKNSCFNLTQHNTIYYRWQIGYLLEIIGCMLLIYALSKE